MVAYRFKWRWLVRNVEWPVVGSEDGDVGPTTRRVAVGILLCGRSERRGERAAERTGAEGRGTEERAETTMAGSIGFPGAHDRGLVEVIGQRGHRHQIIEIVVHAHLRPGRRRSGGGGKSLSGRGVTD